jgi:non-specific serine/threonine protein kinase
LALPHLIKHIYNSGTDEVIRRGKKIHAIGFVELVEHDELTATVTFRVKDDTYSTFYKVQIQKYSDAKLMSLRCGCPYNLGEICRHKAAALFRLQDMVDKNLIGNHAVKYNQKHTVVKMKNIELKLIKMFSSSYIYEQADKWLRTGKANILSAADEKVKATLTVDGKNFQLAIQKNDERTFDTSCSCTEKDHPLCIHKVTLFIQLLNSYGPYYFDTIRNWDKEKEKLLQIYGFSLKDDIEGKFGFTYKEGKPFLKVLDSAIKKINEPLIKTPPPVYIRPVIQPIEEEVVVAEKSSKRLGIVFNFNSKNYPGFTVDCVLGETNEEENKFLGKVEAIDLSKFVNYDILGTEDRQLIQQLRKLHDTEINKYLNRNSPFSGIWENIITHDGDELPEETRELINEYLHPKLKKIFEERSRVDLHYFLPRGVTFKTSNLKEVTASDSPAIPVFRVSPKGGKYEISCQVDLGGRKVPASANQSGCAAIFFYEDSVYLWNRAEDILKVESFLKSGNITVPAEKWSEYMQQHMLPLSREYRVDFDKSLIKEIKGVQPEAQIQLMERGDYLLFQPVFIYNGHRVAGKEKAMLTIPGEEKILIIHRNDEVESDFIKKLENLHSQFSRQTDTNSLVLKGAEVLKNNWFFLFMDAMKEEKVTVFGFEALKNFRFNTAKPRTHIHVSSGLDWFDARVEISFGSQRIGITEIKKAFASKQSFVQLGDGTLGILPDDWIKKYSLLFKVGDGKNESLRLSRYHLSVIDDLYENRDESEISFNLDEKFEKLKGFKKIPKTKPGKDLLPILRPYQLSGFQWLNYLNEVGWGGILADDMGLGKTLQALSMLDHYKKTTGKLFALVICPTTLIYNWKNEISKFTPSLKHLIHHGNARERTSEALSEYNVIITTYGTLRSDIQMLIKLQFDYVVLDESQAIKNPSSKVTKAASLLQTRNRLCMSGTPLQNNTFDIFAQMNFLNPGLLGSMEFFRNEFATPIDKFGEPEQKEHLRKLLFPFILRRTKEQVAKELPEKTETILFCEMDPEQRAIYDSYRNVYREKILGTIEDQGIEKSQLTILQGLMKLRQICDSPAILNEEEKHPNHSIKLEELSREITENIGQHKALIFSQFLGMLSLIKQKLTEANIPFEYFDGSTSAPDREKAIRNFQENESCRVFLISLKAGGVGLNLTAADYVYIVDPWWNPAVEQQAIDRTHRIGQSKNIFAYRMICVDTIEDKILKLQEKKRALAKELITDDQGFVKALTRADVEYLFS